MTRENAQSAQRRRPATVVAVLVLLVFLGLTALGGGIEMILFPSGNQYVPGEWLEGIPWIESWLVPGLVLSIGFGLGSLFSVIEAVYGFIAFALIALALAPSARIHLRHHA